MLLRSCLPSAWAGRCVGLFELHTCCSQVRASDELRGAGLGSSLLVLGQLLLGGIVGKARHVQEVDVGGIGK